MDRATYLDGKNNVEVLSGLRAKLQAQFMCFVKVQDSCFGP
jgi:hypothetical protein